MKNMFNKELPYDYRNQEMAGKEHGSGLPFKVGTTRKENGEPFPKQSKQIVGFPPRKFN